MKLPGIEIKRASQVVAGELRRMILYGSLAGVERLPPEPELAQQLGISHHHLREALRLLEQDGLLEVRRGHSGGIYLRSPDADVLARTFEGILARNRTPLADLMVARSVIEPACARLAAENASEAELDFLDSTIEQQAESELYIPELNAQFHVGVATAAHCQTLLLLMRSIERLVRDLDTTVDDPQLVVEQGRAHRAIVRELRKRDGQRAEYVMGRHLSGFEDRLRADGFDLSQRTVADALMRADSIQRQGGLHLRGFVGERDDR
ncbi:MAG: FadR family transcriptional regulator [Chloroflexi bacterium]|nr:FadR family transcriptional regulator [Chloroflexota bacterium]